MQTKSFTSLKAVASRIARSAKPREMRGRHWIALALFCAQLYASQAGSQQGAALEQAERAAKQHPQSAEAQNAYGESLDEAGQLDAARSQFEKSIALKTNYGQAYLNLGLVSLQLNAPDKAASNLNQAIKLLGKTPEGAYALYLRAKIYTARENYDDALRALNEAVKLRPDLAEAWSDLGETCKAKLDDRGALAAFKKAVDLNPTDAVAQYRLGAEYLRLDNAPQAAEHLRLAYKHSPQDQSVLNALQTALRREGKIAEANQIRAQLAQLLRERDDSMQKAVAAIKLNNEGASLQKAGDLPGALAKYQQASQLDPNHVGIRVNYAIALLRLGHWTDGLNELHEALQRDPGNNQIRLALKDALAQAPPELVPKWPEDGNR
jgi:tetratricopeptide (TPR) repeat protein